MCDLKSFTFLHHFGSGFKYFSATIIRKLSKMLNLRLSGGLIYKYTYNIQVFRKGLRGRICKKVVPKCLIYVCILLVHFSLELVPRFKSGKGGDGRRQAYHFRRRPWRRMAAVKWFRTKFLYLNS